MEIATAGNALAKKEKFKLIRNLSILMTLDLVVIFVFGWLMILYGRLSLLSVLSSALIILFIVPVTIYAFRYIRDIRRGVAEIYSGTVKRKEEDEVVGDEVGSQYLYLNGQRFQVGFLTYLKVRENDQVVIRKAPSSHCTLSVKIIKKNGREN